MPLAGAFAKTREEALAAEKYPLTWEWCRTCGLVNAFPDVPDDLIFSDYSYRASDVPALVRHHREFAAWLTSRYGTGPLDYCEIGGNDGVLLRQLPAWAKTNVDPSDVANVDRDWELVNAPWHGGIGTFDVITSSNAFAHLTDIGAALNDVRSSLKPAGEFVVEVHDLAATLLSCQWDTVYHEHRAEWSVASLMEAGALWGLQLIEWTNLPLHGGMIRAVFRKGTRQGRKPAKPDFVSLQSAYDRRKPPRIPPLSVAYGAAGRATVYINQAQPAVTAVVDGSPRRAGRFMPGVGLPIISPEDFDRLNPLGALITAWNHADDIKARHPDYKGQWVTAW